MNIKIYKLKNKESIITNWQYIISLIKGVITFDNILFIHYSFYYNDEDIIGKHLYNKFIFNISNKEYEALISEDKIIQKMIIEILINKI